MLTSLDIRDHANCPVFYCAACEQDFTPRETNWNEEPNCPQCGSQLPNSVEHFAECENWEVTNEEIGEAIYICQEGWFETHDCDEPTTDETDNVIESMLANMGLGAIHFEDAMPAIVLRQAVEEAMDAWWREVQAVRVAAGD